MQFEGFNFAPDIVFISTSLSVATSMVTTTSFFFMQLLKVDLICLEE